MTPLRAPDYYYEPVNPSERKFNSGKMPFVEWLESANEKAISQQ
jgi:hypothetical protein